MASTNVSERRITGRARQERRLDLWIKNPHCASCGEITAYPYGFELDHIVPLHKGGEDTKENCQILCVYIDADGRKRGCHMDKTAEDTKR